MVNASKILTVSYGTFSCTLEGFDDPFSTMRSIAEYFRDLAADDRYFGAEPPTPDAEMLHRIAEREINRRVEAKVNKNGVVLRQLADDHAKGPVPAQKAEPPQDTTEDPSLTAAGQTHAAGAGAQASETADVDAGKMDAATGESVAEKLRRIRAAVARTHVEPQFTGTFAEDEHAGELFSGRSIDSAFDQPEAESGPHAEVEEQPTVREAISDEAAIEEEATAEPPEESADAEHAEVEAPGADAAGLLDARVDEDEPVQEPAAEAETSKGNEEVVSVGDIAEEAGEELTTDLGEGEDEHAEAASDQAPDADAAAAPADLDEAPAEDVAAGIEAQPEEVETAIGEEAEDFGEAAGRVAADAGAQDLASDEEAEDEAPKAEPLILDAAMAAEAEERIDIEAQIEDLDQDLDIDSLTAKLAAENAADSDAAPAPTESDEAVADAKKSADTKAAGPTVIRARVVKMSRQEFMARYIETTEEEEAEAVADAAPEQMEDVTPERVRASLGETGLSPEDEDDLINELVAAERDANGQSAEATPEVAAKIAEDLQPEAAPAEAAVAVDAPGAPVETDTSSDKDTAEEAPAPTREEISATLKAAVEPVAKKSDDLAVSRLLRQADSELKDNDSSRRRSAIAHLKAAVAAVRADGGRANQDAAAEEARTMDKFRDDLARVVRPETDDTAADQAAGPSQAAAPSASGTARPRRKMPPLMLVSEQRIDKPVSRNLSGEPVRPRRVRAEDEVQDASGEGPREGDNIFGAAEDFSGFVAETEAEGVQELLEASAAFGTLVEGQPFNSRPQIMQRMLRFVPEGTVTREEGLRAFGVLLREGRLIRIQRGQFVLPETSRFRSERKSAAG